MTYVRVWRGIMCASGVIPIDVFRTLSTMTRHSSVALDLTVTSLTPTATSSIISATSPRISYVSSRWVSSPLSLFQCDCDVIVSRVDVDRCMCHGKALTSTVLTLVRWLIVFRGGRILSCLTIPQRWRIKWFRYKPMYAYISVMIDYDS